MLAPLLVLLSSAPVTPAKPGPPAARAAVRRADEERCAALGAKDEGRFLAVLADDVSLFPDRQPLVKGKAAARELLAPFFDAKGPSVTCEPLTVEVAASGELAYTTGTYVVKGTEAERSPTRGHGKYVTVWRKRSGAWKLAVDIANNSPPAERDFGPPPAP